MKNWFKESDVFYENFDDKFSVGYNIQKYPENLEKKSNSVVVIGVDENISDSIRREFYKTSYQFEGVNLADLGNIRNNSPEFSINLLKELIDIKTNIILIGGSKKYFTTQIKNLNHHQGNIAFFEKAGDILFDKETQDIINNNKVNKIKLIAYQSHLIHKSKLTGNLGNNSMRLGQIRNNKIDLEPLLRDVDSSIFNLDCIRYSEVPGLKNTSPSGLTSEEACQIMRYLGLNTCSNILNIVGYDPKFDFNNQAAMLVSQLIWYYLGGVDDMIPDDLIDSNSLTKYIVELSEYNISLYFYQSIKSGRWWVGIPQIQEGENYYLPCSEDDYIKATNNELSTRIFNELSNL